ncbi:site-specific DNA-methyltransferase [Rhodobacterales bacterium LSUCC0031]|nr:site-specific DNA-methyltransferase [Rhodobacterales bacterium LSUCC0031]
MNHLYYGDNLNVLRDLPADHVDLIYLDPPFNSNAGYNQLFKAPDGSGSTAQIEAFNDTWHWGDTAEDAYQAVRRSPNAAAAQMLGAMRSFLGENDMMAYLAMMAVRLIELHRVLKPTGSLYLHCDPTASHYLKIMLDAVFGARYFGSEIIWQRSQAKGLAFTRFANCHDTILRYTKSDRWTWNAQYAAYTEEYTDKFYRHIEPKTGRRYALDNLANPNTNRPNLTYEFMGVTRVWRWTRERMEKALDDGLIHQSSAGSVPRLKRYLDEQEGVPISTIWTDVPFLSGQAQERLGYPTQKPVALLERILSASSNLGDVVLDPFCGCGTTVHAAEKLGRKWIGIDVTHLAIGLIEKRLRDAFPDVQFTTHGVPQDIHAARDLAGRGRDNGNYYFEFEKWALSLIDAQPGNLSKKGADKGIDGNLWFGKTGRAIVSVKAGENIGVGMVRDLRGVIEREKADLGVLLTLNPPKSTMIAEAAAAGQHTEPGFTPVPRIQIVTIEDAMRLRERAVQLPARRADSFRRAPREEDRGAQGQLGL